MINFDNISKAYLINSVTDLRKRIYGYTKIIQVKKSSKTITYERKKKSGSKATNISNLEVKEIHHCLRDLKYIAYKTKLKELKIEVIDKLIYKPAEYYIERYIYHNYVCNNCSKEKDS